MRVINTDSSYSYTISDITPIISTLSLNKKLMELPAAIKYTKLLNELSVKFLHYSTKTIIINTDFFYFPTKINNLEMRMHFNIKEAHRLAENKQRSMINHDYFTNIREPNRFASIGYDEIRTNELERYHFTTLEPILLIEYPITSDIPYLVIDGNHRIAAQKSIKQALPCVFLDALEHPALFICELDYSFYRTMRFIQDYMISSNPELKNKLLF